MDTRNLKAFALIIWISIYKQSWSFTEKFIDVRVCIVDRHSEVCCLDASGDHGGAANNTHPSVFNPDYNIAMSPRNVGGKYHWCSHPGLESARASFSFFFFFGRQNVLIELHPEWLQRNIQILRQKILHDLI